jgi:transposase
LSTKIHLLCDRKGMPLKMILTGGQVHDATQAKVLLQGRKAKRVIADRGYVGTEIRSEILALGAKPVIPNKKNAVTLYPFSKKIYRERNIIERMINRLKGFRRLATRFDKNAVNYLAMVQLAASILWLRVN